MISQNIKRFRMEVQVKDSSEFMRKFDNFVTLLTDEMRTSGFVPVLDLGTHTSVDYNGKVFNYVLTMHGVFIGKKAAWEITGLAGGKKIPRTTTTKSEPSSGK